MPISWGMQNIMQEVTTPVRSIVLRPSSSVWWPLPWKHTTFFVWFWASRGHTHHVFHHLKFHSPDQIFWQIASPTYVLQATKSGMEAWECNTVSQNGAWEYD